MFVWATSRDALSVSCPQNHTSNDSSRSQRKLLNVATDADKKSMLNIVVMCNIEGIGY